MDFGLAGIFCRIEPALRERTAMQGPILGGQLRLRGAGFALAFLPQINNIGYHDDSIQHFCRDF